MTVGSETRGLSSGLIEDIARAGFTGPVDLDGLLPVIERVLTTRRGRCVSRRPIPFAPGLPGHIRKSMN